MQTRFFGVKARPLLAVAVRAAVNERLRPLRKKRICASEDYIN